MRSSRSSATVAETNFSGIFCESISTTVSARYTVGSERTTATAQRAKKIHATVMRIFLFQIVLRMERGENPREAGLRLLHFRVGVVDHVFPVLYGAIRGPKAEVCICNGLEAARGARTSDWLGLAVAVSQVLEYQT